MIIKSFKLFESSNDQEIHDICDKYRIKNYSINEDGSIDVDGNVDLGDKNLSKLPIKFGKVGGFYCYNNKLTSLEGAPNHVDGNFNCKYNKLTSLDGSPGYVGGDFYCQYNQLTSLEGAPSHVGRDFYCSYNQLISLEGAPSYVGGDFYCVGNPIFEIYSLFNNKKCIDSINEYDVIQGKNIVLSRLEEVYHELGMKVPNEFNFKYYKLID